MSAIVKSNPTENKYLIGAELEALRNVQKALPFLSAPKVYRLSSKLEGHFKYLKDDYTKVVYIPTGRIISSRLICSIFNGLHPTKIQLILDRLGKGLEIDLFNNGINRKATVPTMLFKDDSTVISMYYIKGVVLFKGNSKWEQLAIKFSNPNSMYVLRDILSTYTK